MDKESDTVFADNIADKTEALRQKPHSKAFSRSTLRSTKSTSKKFSFVSTRIGIRRSGSRRRHRSSSRRRSLSKRSSGLYAVDVNGNFILISLQYSICAFQYWFRYIMLNLFSWVIKVVHYYLKWTVPCIVSRCYTCFRIFLWPTEEAPDFGSNQQRTKSNKRWSVGMFLKKNLEQTNVYVFYWNRNMRSAQHKTIIL